MSNYKSETKEAYDKFAPEFEKKFEEHFYKYVQEKADKYIILLKGKTILDLGSGPGNHAIYFKQKGLNVFCLDNSEEMIKLCKEKGLYAKLGDIEDLKFAPESFDGVWAYASLLHIPKEKIGTILEKIYLILKKEGLLAIALKEGSGEGFETDERYPGSKRWFSYYSEEEIGGIFGKYFVIKAHSKTVGKKTIFNHYILKKKSIS